MNTRTAFPVGIDTQGLGDASLLTNSGASLVNWKQGGTGAQTISAAEVFQIEVNALQFMTKAQRTDVLARTASIPVDVALNNARAYLSSIGGGILYMPAGFYLMANPLTLDYPDKNIAIRGDGIGATQFKKNVSTHYLQVGSLSNRITSEGNTLASNAAAGAITITLSTGKGANISAGSTCMLVSNAAIPGFGTGVTQKTAEFVNVFSKSGDTLTLSAPLTFPYNVSDSAEIQRINWVNGFSISGVGFDGENYFTDGVNVNHDNVAEIYYAYNARVSDVAAWKLINLFMLFTGCMFAQISEFHARDQLSDGIEGNVGSFGYSLAEGGLNYGLSATNICVDAVRHAYTTCVLNLFYGVPMASRISNGTATNMRGSAWDTHPEALAIGFSNVSVIGSLGLGIQMRGVNCQVNNWHAQSCIAAAFYATNTSIGTKIGPGEYSNTNLGTWDSSDWTILPAIYNLGTSTSYSALQTGTGFKVVVDTSPTLVTPIIGAASATSLGIGGTLLAGLPIGAAPVLELQGLTNSSTGAAYANWSSTIGRASNVQFVRSIGNAVGTRGGITASGTALGFQSYIGDDGANWVESVRIECDTDGTCSTNNMPGRMIISTNGGGNAVTERMRIDSSGYTSFANGGIKISGNVAISTTVPTISSGFGAGASLVANGTATFRVSVGTGGTATGGVFSMPAAANGWNATIQVFNPNSTNCLQETFVSSSTTTSLTLTNLLLSTGAATAWPSGTVLIINAVAY